MGVRIVDTHNVDSDLMRRYVPHVQGFVRRLYARLTARKLEALERHSFREVDRVWVCSQDEADLLERRGWEAAVRVIPNSVDVAHFAAYEGAVVRNRLLFFGKLDYFPNVDALHFLVEEIVPRLRGRVDFEIKVIGAGKTDGIADACAACPELELVGRVDDVRSWLATAGLVVVPLRMGSGTRLKILEAMAAGRPILSTTIGAEGIAADSGRHILRADSAEDFADEIVRVLPDHALGDSIGAEGQGLVRSRYDWLAIGTAIERELEESLGARDAL